MPGCCVEVGAIGASTPRVELALRVYVETLLPVLTIREELTGDGGVDVGAAVPVLTVRPEPTSLPHIATSILLILSAFIYVRCSISTTTKSTCHIV